MVKVIVAGIPHEYQVARKEVSDSRLGVCIWRIVFAVIPVLPGGVNRLEGKFSIGSCSDNNSRSMPVGSMFWIGMEFACRLFIGIVIAQGTVKKFVWSEMISIILTIVQVKNSFDMGHDGLHNCRNGVRGHEFA